MKDLTYLKTYIIDTKNPKEIDDAISLEIDDSGRVYIWTHISCPVMLFDFNSDVEKKAMHYCSSLYLINKYIPMIETEITKKANLEQNKVSATLSTRMELSEDGSLMNYKILESKIKPNYELTFEEANELLDLQPKEEYELAKLMDILMKSSEYRKKNGAISFDMQYSKIEISDNDNVVLKKIETTNAHRLISEAMILTGYVYSDYLIKHNIPAPFRTQKVNCDTKEILDRNSNSLVKYSILKQYIGKSYITTKPNAHETLGLKSYVQGTSPLRRYLDLIVQRQIYSKLNNLSLISEQEISGIIEICNKKQQEVNSIIKENKMRYLRIFFDNNEKIQKIIFIRWINKKRSIALVYFPEYYLESLILLYTSIDFYINKTYKVKYNKNETSSLLEFIN